MNTYGIKFKCSLNEYTKLPRNNLVRAYGLGFDFCQGFGVVRSACDKFRGRENELSYEDAKNILWHINEFGLKED